MISSNMSLVENNFIVILMSFCTSKRTTHAIHDVRVASGNSEKHKFKLLWVI